MDNRDYRWIAGILLIAVFGVMAYGGGRVAPKAQTTQNVLVTNTSSQPIPIAARPGTGAYIVSVANAPSVKVISSPAAPVMTKDVNNPDVNGAITRGQFVMASPTGGENTAPFSLSALPVVIDAISIEGQSIVAGECVDSGSVGVFDQAMSLLGSFYFTIPAVQNGNSASDYLGTVHLPVPANGSIVIQVARHGGVTNNCVVFYTIAYHTVPN